ncbi:MAG: WbqC family protein [Bacteroidia bacterium]|nr:WbqC family protein [Bacteroidia bacterium]MCZ2277705.1 WbqC family protein [Bacteroidia bacterium]
MGRFPVLTTSCLPPIGYIKLILESGGAVIDIHEHFVKQTIRNHYSVLSANGILQLSIPVKHSKIKIPVHQVRICYDQPWQRQHLNAIRSAYGRAAFFQFYFEELENIFCSSPERLTVFNDLLLKWIFKCLKQDPLITFTKKYTDNYENDQRHASLKHSSHFLHLSRDISYAQVYSDRFAFKPNLSILDLIFNAAQYTQA